MSTVTTIEIHARRKTNSYCEEWAKLMSSIGKEYLDKMKVVIPRESGFRLDRISGKVMVDKGTMIKLVGLDGKYNSDYFFLTYSELVRKPMKLDIKRKPEQYTLKWKQFCDSKNYSYDHVFTVEVPNIQHPNQLCDATVQIPEYGSCEGHVFTFVREYPKENDIQIPWDKAPRGAHLWHQGSWYSLTNGFLYYFFETRDPRSFSGWEISSKYKNPEDMFLADAVYSRQGRVFNLTEALAIIHPAAKEEGKKYDAGKPMMAAIPPNAARSVAEVLTFGAQKYGRGNWHKVENAETRYLDAALRHINDYQRGITMDEESGKPTLAHAICDLMFILEKNLEKTK